MSNIVDGKVEAVSTKGPFEGQYGEYYRHGIKVNGQFYNMLGNKDDAPAKGDEVVFQMKDRGKFKDVVKKSLMIKSSSGSGQVAESRPAPTAGMSSSNYRSEAALGAQVGQALNLAVKEAELQGLQVLDVGSLRNRAHDFFCLINQLRKDLSDEHRGLSDEDKTTVDYDPDEDISF